MVMREVRACGVLVVRGTPPQEFLLMQHAHRLDLPKGHMEAGESDLQCALREMTEETGIPANAVVIDPNFQFVHDYYVRYRVYNNEKVHKTLVLFLATLVQDVTIQVTEHAGYEWRKWHPPHKIQTETIDPLLAAVEKHLATRDNLQSEQI
jgi:bis(5'-nucleosidyl)-tetraphosphatase